MKALDCRLSYNQKHYTTKAAASPQDKHLYMGNTLCFPYSFLSHLQYKTEALSLGKDGAKSWGRCVEVGVSKLWKIKPKNRGKENFGNV